MNTSISDPARTPESWATDWPRHEGDIVRYASHLLGGDVQAAEDVAQETALRLWQHPEVLADGRPLTGWLRTAARNIVIDRARRRRSRPTEVGLTPAVDAEAPGDLDHVDAAEAITTILSGLSARHRDVVFEVYVRDRPVAEVAAALGVPTGTVKSRCHTAIRQLRASASPTCA